MKFLTSFSKIWPRVLYLMSMVCLCAGCNEAINTDSLHDDSVMAPLNGGSVSVLYEDVSDWQIPSVNGGQLDDRPDHVSDGSDWEPGSAETENPEEPDEKIHDEPDDGEQAQARPDDDRPQDDSDNGADAEQPPVDGDQEVAGTDHEDIPGDSVALHEWAQPVEAAGLPNLFKVSKTVYRSAQPESGGFESAEKLGIKTILSVRLTANDAVLAESEPTSLTLIHIPLVPLYITDEEMLEVMKAFDSAEKPVLVHCLHGADRTGLTIALYRILYENWSKEEAKNELVNGGFGYHSALTNILDYIDAFDADAFKTQLFGD